MKFGTERARTYGGAIRGAAYTADASLPLSAATSTIFKAERRERITHEISAACVGAAMYSVPIFGIEA